MSDNDNVKLTRSTAKIDKNGNYLQFRGIIPIIIIFTLLVVYILKNNKLFYKGTTIICALSASSRQSLSKLIGDLPNLKKIVSFLPESSWHMTIAGIYSEKAFKKPWNFDSYFAESAKQNSELSKHCLDSDCSPSMTIKSITNDCVLALELEFKSKQDREMTLSCRNKIFDILQRKPSSYGPHLTLGYHFANKCSKEQFKAIEKEVVELQKRCDKEKLVLTFEPARFCKYKSMKHFEPWQNQKTN
jgi:hypothetical protein